MTTPLAFNFEGEAFELPPTAAGWRVKRMRDGKGAPELVYGSDGVPLVIPLDTDMGELRRTVVAPGKYRLDPVDDQHRVIKSVDAAYVFVRSAEPVQVTAEPGTGPNTNAVIMEAMRQNAEMARTIVDRFPAMLEASAILLKAADGAGLPSREPRRNEREDDDNDGDDDEDDDDGDMDTGEPAPVQGFDLNALIAKFLPALLTMLAEGKLKIPNLAEMLDWRRAVPKKPAQGAAHHKPPTGTKPKPPAASAPEGEAPASAAEAPASAATDVDAEMPPLSPQAIAHFLAIQSALTPEEAWLARAAASELSPSLLRAWFDELSALSVPEAVARVRTLVTGPRAAEAAA